MTRWVADDAPLVNTDVVLWFVFGVHHVTRMEEWPIMSADVTSFWLRPSVFDRGRHAQRARYGLADAIEARNFFDQNPALDVPAEPKAACHVPHDAAPAGRRGVRSLRLPGAGHQCRTPPRQKDSMSGYAVVDPASGETVRTYPTITDDEPGKRSAVVRSGRP